MKPEHPPTTPQAGAVEPIIRLQDISKSFGTVTANDRISLDIVPGRIKAILGENGAGKSTLMNILAGGLQPDAGHLQVLGRPRVFHSPKQAIAAGVGMIYQHFMLVEAFSVAENVVLGQEPSRLTRPATIRNRVGELARQFGLDVSPEARVADLSMGEKQRVEILKLLYRESSVLILDEPTAVLTPPEVDNLFQAMRRMAAQGKAVVFISHKLDEVMSVADEIAILRKGRIVDEMDISEVSSSRDLALRMVGREVFLRPKRPPVALGEEVLNLQNLKRPGLEGVSLHLRQGEIVAVVGVAGNGQKPLVDTVCGLEPPLEGDITFSGQDWATFFTRRDWNEQLCYIPEDRLGLGTCPGLSLTDNFLLTNRHRFSKGLWLDHKAGREVLEKLLTRFNVHPPAPDLQARHLSGGNLQKLVLARELSKNPVLIVAEQPSQGLDIAATEEVWSGLLQARSQAGILLVTGDLNEALALADRVAVMYRGRFVDVFAASDSQKVANMGPMLAGIVDHDPAHHP